MREILFRGKSEEEKQWVYGGIVHQTDFYGNPVDRYFIIDGTNTQDYDIGPETEVLPDTVGQFTGLLDRNGNKIFEGDIVCFATAFNRCASPLLIEFSNFEWVAKAHTNYFHRLEHDDKIEVIGNKWDNPELLNP